MTIKRFILSFVLSAGLIFGGFTLAPSAQACGDCNEPPAKCNSGRGNDSETEPENDCDPGNSGGHNQGGD